MALPDRAMEGHKILLTVEAHLQIDETILNPSRIGPVVAAKIAELLEDMYAIKTQSSDENSARVRKKKTAAQVRMVHTLAVSHRTADMAERLDTQE